MVRSRLLGAVLARLWILRVHTVKRIFVVVGMMVAATTFAQSSNLTKAQEGRKVVGQCYATCAARSEPLWSAGGRPCTRACDPDHHSYVLPQSGCR